jgi:hypothetical protein
VPRVRLFRKQYRENYFRGFERSFRQIDARRARPQLALQRDDDRLLLISTIRTSASRASSSTVHRARIFIGYHRQSFPVEKAVGNISA